jgi:pyruvyl transferase EpsI
VSAIRKAYVRARIRLALARAKPDKTVRSTEPDRPHVFVALAADYGNVGDLAITHAQVHFLSKAFPEAVVEPLPISRTLPAIKQLKRTIGEHDVVTLIGGGNTGDLYDDIQYLRELFVRTFRHTPVISFPQTIEFSDTVYGRWAKWRARRAYNRHRRLSIMARDSRSYELAASMFADCEVVLAPDVVLTLDRSSEPSGRSGVLVALRADLERAIDDDAREAVVSAAADLGTVRSRDTHVGDVRLSLSEADAVLVDYWHDWRSASVVLTDRLHGVIFSVITGTPCVALDSGTGKVGQFYSDWLRDMPGVHLLSSDDADPVAGQLVRLRDGGRPDPRLLAAVFDARFSETAIGRGRK